MAAAYRWNIRRVMWTAASLIGVLAAQAAILRISVVHSFVGTDYDTNRLIMRAAYLLVGSVVIGYIASNEKRLIREAAFVGSVVSLPRAERGLKRSAQMVLCEIARFFCAPKAAMLIRIHGGSTYLLECTAGDTEKDWTDLSPAEVEPWLFSVAANCAWVVRNAAATNLLDRTARWRSRKSRGEVQLPLRFVETNRFKDLLLANLVMADDWSGRIFLFDPQPQSDPRSALDLLDRIVRQVTPAVHNVYLLKRIRGRAQAAQRVRLAHDLHDGAMQALVAACYQLEILQRNSALPFEAAAEVRKTEEMVRKEVGSLRVLMQDLHARSLKEPDFAANLLEMINDFRGYAEIDITLSWDPATVKMPASVARETLKIIQEGLLNIHKHSGAKHATVELSNAGSQLQITIEDDGVGLEFDGRLEIRNLEELRIGPRVIRQRLQDLGGNLAIESHLDRGTRLEIGIPLRQHAAAVRQGSGAR
jgi:signal transduction histidine kinase